MSDRTKIRACGEQSKCGTPVVEATMINPEIKKYLSEIARRGGLKSRRVLTTEQSRRMIAAREANRAGRKNKA